jgi:hypothetical protein
MLTLVSLILIALSLTPVYASNNDNTIDKNLQQFFENNEMPQESETETFKNMVITLIKPYVDNAIADYYSEYMVCPPREDPFSYEFLSIVKNSNYSYTLKLQVQPFVGPHNSVGLDHITLKIDTEGVTIEKYEHLKSYDLPPNYDWIFKKKLSYTHSLVCHYTSH